MDGRLDDVMFCWDATFLLVKRPISHLVPAVCLT
jgi:hypothetical protein